MTPSEARPRFALVTPWFGRELIGGAERLAWELSSALIRQSVDVDVLTTTCRSFHDDWGANYHRPGMSIVDGVRLLRFNVDSRDRAAFSRANAKLLTLPRESLRPDVAPLPARETEAFFRDNVGSSALLEHLRGHGQSYDAVFFVPYLYGPIFNGIPLVGDRAFVIPCLHDEAYAYLEPIRRSFLAARGLLFNSAGEQEVAGSIFGPWIHAKSVVIGHAVDPIRPPRSPLSVSGFAPHRSRYVFYLGRQDKTKNVDFLIDAFLAFRASRAATSLQLVLAGPRPAGAPSRDGIVWLGAVAEDVKAALLTYARALAQPSINESFSRTIFESWYAQRPVIVHGACRATARAVEESGGGWIGTTREDWVRILTLIDESSDEAIDALGRRGSAAAIENGSWDAVAIRALEAVEARFGRFARGMAIDQIVPLGDTHAAVYAASLGDALRAEGADVSVSIPNGGTQRAHAQTIVHASFEELQPESGDVVVVHNAHVIIGELAPPLFAPTVAVLQALIERGIPARLLPQPIDPGCWATAGHATLRTAGIGPSVISIAPLLRGDVERLIETVVAYIGVAGPVRLFVAESDCDAEALEALKFERRELDLEDVVILVGDGKAERYAVLRAARLAVALGQPLRDVRSAVEPLWFDIPIVGFDDPIVREVVEPCGLVVERSTPLEIATVLKAVIRTDHLRNAMVSEGWRVRARYAPAAVAATLVETLVNSAQPAVSDRNVRR